MDSGEFVFSTPRPKLSRSRTFVVNENPIGEVKRNPFGHYYISPNDYSLDELQHDQFNKPKKHYLHNTLPCNSSFTFFAKSTSTQTLPTTESKSTSTFEDENTQLAEIFTPSLAMNRNGSILLLFYKLIW